MSKPKRRFQWRPDRRQNGPVRITSDGKLAGMDETTRLYLRAIRKLATPAR